VNEHKQGFQGNVSTGHNKGVAAPPSTSCQWCGLRPSVIRTRMVWDQNNRSWSWHWSRRSGVVLWNTVLSRSS